MFNNFLFRRLNVAQRNHLICNLITATHYLPILFINPSPFRGGVKTFFGEVQKWFLLTRRACVTLQGCGDKINHLYAAFFPFIFQNSYFSAIF